MKKYSSPSPLPPDTQCYHLDLHGFLHSDTSYWSPRRHNPTPSLSLPFVSVESAASKLQIEEMFSSMTNSKLCLLLCIKKRLPKFRAPFPDISCCRYKYSFWPISITPKKTGMPWVHSTTMLAEIKSLNSQVMWLMSACIKL